MNFVLIFAYWLFILGCMDLVQLPYVILSLVLGKKTKYPITHHLAQFSVGVALFVWFGVYLFGWGIWK